jgi:hypothetical protein
MTRRDDDENNCLTQLSQVDHRILSEHAHRALTRDRFH